MELQHLLVNRIDYNEYNYTLLYEFEEYFLFVDYFNFKEVGFDYDYFTQIQNDYMLRKKVYRLLWNYVDEVDCYRLNEIQYYDVKYRNQRRDETYADATPAEDAFEKRFEEYYGIEYMKAIHREFKIEDEYKRSIFIDYVVETKEGYIGFEINGVQYHHPMSLGEKDYHKQCLRQNAIVRNNIKLYRFSYYECLFKDKMYSYFSKLLQQDTMVLQDRMKEKRRLYQHQEEALHKLEEEEQCALIFPTGTGKSQIIISYLERHLDYRTLIIAPTTTITNDWKERCKHLSHLDIMTYQAFYLLDRPTTYYDCIVVDEAHHAMATTMKLRLERYQPKKLIGLTATPERLDQRRIEEVFGRYETTLTLEDAIKQGILSEVYVYRIKSNLDLSNVRYNGKNYENRDLERCLKVDSRDELIIDTIKEYFNDSNFHGIIFGVSVDHCKRLAKRLQEEGFHAKAVGGKLKDSKQSIEGYMKKEIQFLCSCQLLNEGWDAPHTNVLIMARPTMSKVLYLQQLGRGLRKYPGKEGVFVVDVVDEYGALLKPWSCNAIFTMNYYKPFMNILNQDKQSIIIDGLKEQLLGLETIDIHTFETMYKTYLSKEEVARTLFLDTKTITNWLTKNKIQADVYVPFGKSEYPLFHPDTVEKIRIDNQLKIHNNDTIFEDFNEFIEKKDYTYSFKIIFLLEFINQMNINGEIEINTLLEAYTNFYKHRIERNLPVDRQGCIYTLAYLNDQKAMKRNMLDNPFEKYERKGFILYSKELDVLSIHPILFSYFNEAYINKLKETLETHLHEYYIHLGGQ